MTSDTPEISVVMPVYNGEPFLISAIESILNQTFEDFEFIIINDGSTDNSADIIKQYAQKDARIRQIDQKNQGLIKTLNLGIEKSKAPLIARMDADDIALAHRLASQKAYMDSHIDVVALGSAAIIIDEQDNEANTMYYPQSSTIKDYIYNLGSPIAHPAALIRKKALLTVNGYREAYKHAEDYDLWLRLIKIGKLDNMQQPLLKYRHHNNKISVRHAEQQAIASVVARHASLAEKDPTSELKTIDKTTFKLINHNTDALNIEVLDILAAGPLLTSNEKIIDAFKEKLPSKIPYEAKHFASRIHLKLALAYLKTKKISKACIHISKAFILSPSSVLKTLKSRLSKR